MVFGEERLFISDLLPVLEGFHEFFLRFLHSEPIGIKMKGDFPRLWEVEQGEITGPELFDEDHVYKVTSLDYDRRLIWLKSY